MSYSGLHYGGRPVGLGQDLVSRITTARDARALLPAGLTAVSRTATAFRADHLMSTSLARSARLLATPSVAVPPYCADAALGFGGGWRRPRDPLAAGSWVVYGIIVPDGLRVATVSANLRRNIESRLRSMKVPMVDGSFKKLPTVVVGDIPKMTGATGVTMAVERTYPMYAAMRMPISGGGVRLARLSNAVQSTVLTAARAVGLQAPVVVPTEWLGPESGVPHETVGIVAANALNDVFIAIAAGIRAIRVDDFAAPLLRGARSDVNDLRESARVLTTYDSIAEAAVRTARLSLDQETYEQGKPYIKQGRDQIATGRLWIDRGVSTLGRDPARMLGDRIADLPAKLRQGLERELSKTRGTRYTEVERRYVECQLWKKAAGVMGSYHAALEAQRPELQAAIGAFNTAIVNQPAATDAFNRASAAIDEIEADLQDKFFGTRSWILRKFLGIPVWGWMIGGTALVGGGSYLMLRKPRTPKA